MSMWERMEQKDNEGHNGLPKMPLPIHYEKRVTNLSSQRDDLQARANHYEAEKGRQAEMLNSVIQHRDELLRVADGINARRKLRGSLVPQDAEDMLAAIAKVKP